MFLEEQIMDIVSTVNKQREYFLSGATRDINKRLANLKQIRCLLEKYSNKFYEAFHLDYNKCQFDVLSTELLLVLNECDYMIKHLKKLTKAKKVKTDIINFPSKGYLIQEPYGVVLIMAPWNYPLQLSIEPLIGAIAAGNTVILKPASYAKNVSQVIYDMFAELNNECLVSVVLGGREQNQALLEQRFDYIFFTGGETVGKLVLEKASKHLTPVSLELGGKSPTIVDEDADIEIAAKRITWGKFLNAGQTCVAPDYIYVHETVHDAFIEKVKKYIKEFYYDSNGKISSQFPFLINEKHRNKVESLIDKDKIIVGGKFNGNLLEPTVLDNVTWDDKIMSEEIFGPVMPVLKFNDLENVLEIVKHKEKPLAFYYFTKNKKKAMRVMNEAFYGGGCINETIMHLTNENLPFGGVGRSGMGAYHGKKSFQTFSHEKSVLVKNKAELQVKYPPNSTKAFKLLNVLAKIKERRGE